MLTALKVVALLAHSVAETAERTRTRMDRLGDLDLASHPLLLFERPQEPGQDVLLRAQLR